VLLAILLTGCTATADTRPANPSKAKCDLTPLMPMIGQPGTAELGAEALQLSGAQSLRWKSPGAMVTMDYRPDRLNASLDEGNRVTAFDCG
jgi:hypothetical protein